MKTTNEQLRRLGSGAVLTFVSGVILGCGGGDNNPAAPEPPPDEGQTPVAGCSDGVLEHGALYRICFPDNWNGDLVLYAHGYVEPTSPLALPDDQVNGQSIAVTVNGLGYAYATTSYRANGLVVPEATEDLLELETTARRLYRPGPEQDVHPGCFRRRTGGDAGGRAPSPELRGRAGCLRPARQLPQAARLLRRLPGRVRLPLPRCHPRLGGGHSRFGRGPLGRHLHAGGRGGACDSPELLHGSW